MKNSIKGFLIAGVLLVMTGVKAESDDRLSFMGATLGDFFDNFVPEDERAQFVTYYNRFSELFGKVDKERQDATHTKLFKTGIEYLKNTESDKCDLIVDRIKQLRSGQEVDQKELQDVQRFLVRCGVYADFLALKEKLADYKQMATFVDEKFNDFLEKIVDQKDREGFARYYEKLAAEITQCDTPKRTATHHYLFKKALDHMEYAHPDWHKILVSYSAKNNKDLSKNPVVARARLFLRRYGAYQEFLENRALAGVTEEPRGGMFAQIGSFFSNVGKTVAGWFGFGVTQTV